MCEKTEEEKNRTGTLNIMYTILVDEGRTAEFQTTTGLRKIIENDGDVLAIFQDRLLPFDDIQALELAKEVLTSPPNVGYLTIYNALQWTLQYRRFIEKAGDVPGVQRIR